MILVAAGAARGVNKNSRPVFDCDGRAGQNPPYHQRTGGLMDFAQQQQQATPVLLAHEANHR
jgi:hypothetical protein